MAGARETVSAELTWGDIRDGSVYLVDPDLRLSIEVALATNRPLLLRGEPGSGKSSLAAYVARNLKARYYEFVVTANTTTQDFLWKFDSARKIAETARGFSGEPALSDYDYVEPGVFWWALDRRTALRRGAPKGVAIFSEALEPNAELNARRSPSAATVLVDEIDKAHSSVHNDLLVPLGSSEFVVRETLSRIRPSTRGVGQIKQLLIVLTTNEIRELPVAFLRRCVVHYLAFPDEDRLVEIAKIHGSRWRFRPKASDESLFRDVAIRVLAIREEAKEEAWRPPSTAEYIDAIKACRALNVRVGSDEWDRIERICLLKRPRSEVTTF